MIKDNVKADVILTEKEILAGKHLAVAQRILDEINKGEHLIGLENERENGEGLTVNDVSPGGFSIYDTEAVYGDFWYGISIQYSAFVNKMFLLVVGNSIDDETVKNCEEELKGIVDKYLDGVKIIVER